MSLLLDARQRAMLAEMGIRLFDAAPAEAAVMEAAAGVQAAPATRVAPPSSAPMPREASVAPHSAAPAPVRPVQAAVLAAPGVQPASDALRPAGVGSMDWAELEAAVSGCVACKLCHARRNPVFGVGPQQADWMVIGEAPGEQEDLAAEPFVGPSGKLLDNMLAALGLNRRSNVYIANVLKCRPPGNRNPEPDEVAQCEPFLRRQVELVQPKIILAMGRFAVQSILQTTEPVGKLRGRAHAYNGVPVVVTYHPAYLLRNLPDKAKAWADLCLAREIAG
jgi:DNA polymerase